MRAKSTSDANNAAGRSISQTSDTHRAWLWWFLALLAASQLYFVRELVAAFALFAIGFAAVAFVVASLYLLTRVSGLAINRLSELRQPAIIAAVSSEHRKVA